MLPQFRNVLLWSGTCITTNDDGSEEAEQALCCIDSQMATTIHSFEGLLQMQGIPDKKNKDNKQKAET